jgi:AraC family transcriptional regulator
MAEIGTLQKPPAMIPGLEQFRVASDSAGISYCVAEGKPSALELSNDDDIICLVFGDITTRSKFEDDRENDVVFFGGSTAFHPRGGNLRVRAKEVRQGFVSIGYSDAFRSLVDDLDIDGLRRGGSQNNIRNPAIRSLVGYARERLRRPEPLQSLELQFLATAAYIETMRQLAATHVLRDTLSDGQFGALCAYIEDNLDTKITCANLVHEINLPLRVIFDGVKARTGRSPYGLVIESRVRRAQEMLLKTEAPIAEIAAACGFCSQQHLTATLSRKLGVTPQQFRVSSSPGRAVVRRQTSLRRLPEPSAPRMTEATGREVAPDSATRIRARQRARRSGS